jgi:NAD(P)-dependent dehydrogenase (short-subunit alcohol dehydrogenase family)
MVDQGSGAILNIGSVTSYRPLSRVFVYSASKAAVLSLTQNVARELAPHGVRVNCLCPGFFPAEQNRKILDKARVDSILRHTPMGRLGDAPELIGAMLLLLSPTAGSFITGEAIYVDGGFTAMTI